MAAAPNAVDGVDSGSKTLKLENFDKRDTLTAWEKSAQQKWAEAKVYESDAPSIKDVPLHSISAAELRSKQPKFFGTMAYPYMNGRLHLGHSFTASKIEFGARVAQMQGRRVLFPQGYHCTGMPIKACADKLVREIELFGENFERFQESDLANGEKEDPPAPTQEQTKTDVTKFVAKKSKAAAKAVKGATYQFQIMQSLGIPLQDIHKFADSRYWLEYFPPLCKKDLTDFGARVDWRRSFVTTDANPYYDSFIRWQMRRLKELGKIKFGKRYTMYSPKDQQACLDHDRSTGEGVGVQEYTGLKMKVEEWAESAHQILKDKLPQNANVYFVAATLRPETMYGQTGCYVSKSITYGIFKRSETEFFFVTDRAARNMAYQNIGPEWGSFPKVAELSGADVVGTLVSAPLSVHGKVRILPMETVKATKGTGVVTSVPSDSPDDFITVQDLAKKPDWYGIKKEWTELEIIPIIETPSYGNLTAPKLVKDMKINGPKDAKLAEAKDLAYKEGFYQGVMLVGEHKGKPVSEAKNLVKQSLIDAGDAFNYAEPDGLVISRSGDECVAAHLDQWYLNYGTTENGGDGEWCSTVSNWVEDGLNTFSTETMHAFQRTLGWLGSWACTRSFGLGSVLPWDPTAKVESLSDSTIYMAYYTIAHFLHKDNFGREKGLGNISVDQMTDEVWDYVFARREDVQSDISKETMESMRREFEYWYPLDVRISGKDLIQNHLTFFLYIHIALFPQEYWPQAIRVNGHLLLNGEKMSKSTGNFLTLNEAVSKFGADATRCALADAGDEIEDANFEETVANSFVLRLYELRKWCEDEIKNQDQLRTSSKVLWDDIFEDEMNGLVAEAVSAYNATMCKLALKAGYYDLSGARNEYRKSCDAAGIGMHRDLIRRYIELQALMLAPVAPHWSEYIWTEVLQKPHLIQHETWPSVAEPVPTISATRNYIRACLSNVGSAEGSQQKKLAKGKNVAFDPHKPKKLTVFVARDWPAWQEKYIELVRESFEKMKVVDIKALAPKIDKSESKKAMPFITGLKKRLEAGESDKAVFERKLPYDELAILRQMVPVLKSTMNNLKEVEIVSVEEGGKSGVVVNEDGSEGEKRELDPAPQALPGSPSFHFVNL